METKNKEINTIDGLKNPAIENSEVKNNQNEKTFNRLRDLQTLIKKESALKELCKKIYKIIKYKYFHDF
jgi:hypothetical protein